MDEILKKDIKGLKFITQLEFDYLESKKPSRRENLIISFQEGLRNCLLEYLNTPFLLSHKKSKTIRALEEQYLHMGIEAKSLSFNTNIKDLPPIICHSYIKLQSFLKEVKTMGLGYEMNLNLDKTTKNYYNEFPEIEKYIFFTRRKLAKYLYASIIHGSCADLELTPFSDLDTFLIINKYTIFSEIALIKFKKQWQKSLKYLYKFDSLQHHNHMVATEVDINFFPYHWLPPQILDEAKLISGVSRFSPNINKRSFYNAKVFFTLVQRFRDPDIKKKKYTEYSLKNDISILSLLPVLYLQSIGVDATKKESFYHNKLLSIDNDGFFKGISNFRKEWKVTRKSKFIISTLYNFYIRKLYLKYIMPPVGTTKITNNSMLKKEFLVTLNILIDKMSVNIFDAAN